MIGDNGITTWSSFVLVVAFAVESAVLVWVLLQYSRNRKDNSDTGRSK